MIGNLKNALLKAGLKASIKENDRKPTSKKKMKKNEQFQQQRNFCELCETYQRDVELYNHRKRLLDAKWLCVVCADKEMIDDNFRATNQSEFSKSRQFRRGYGATKKNDNKTIYKGKQ